MAIYNIYVNNTLNVNELNDSVKRHRVALADVAQWLSAGL